MPRVRGFVTLKGKTRFGALLNRCYLFMSLNLVLLSVVYSGKETGMKYEAFKSLIFKI